MGYSGQTRTKI